MGLVFKCLRKKAEMGSAKRQIMYFMKHDMYTLTDEASGRDLRIEHGLFVATDKALEAWVEIPSD